MTPENYKKLKVGDVVRNAVTGAYYEITTVSGHIYCMRPAMHADHADMYELVQQAEVTHGTKQDELQKGHSSTQSSGKNSGAVQS